MTSFRKLPALALGALTMLLAVPAAADARTPRVDRTIKLAESLERIVSVGGFRPDHRVAGADPSVDAATTRFGRPSRSNARRDGTCRVRWRRLGLTIVFQAPGEGGRACDTGEAQEIRIGGRRGRGWRTDRGVGIRTPVAKMTRRYPDAQYMGVGTYSVVRQQLTFGNDPNFDLLRAYVTTQVPTPRVMSLRLYPLAALYPPSERN